MKLLFYVQSLITYRESLIGLYLFSDNYIVDNVIDGLRE